MLTLMNSLPMNVHDIAIFETHDARESSSHIKIKILGKYTYEQALHAIIILKVFFK